MMTESRTRRARAFALAVAGLCLALASCGIKGPLEDPEPERREAPDSDERG